MAALLPDIARRVRAAAQERGEREPDKGQAVGTCTMGSEHLQRTSVDQSSRAWMATCLAALSTRLSSAQRAFARAFWLASPAAAVQVIVCSEPTNVDRWRRLQPGMSSSGVMLPWAPSRARQHDSQKQQKRHPAARPLPQHLKQYFLEMLVKVEYLGSTTGQWNLG